jgi:hypothetical protein
VWLISYHHKKGIKMRIWDINPGFLNDRSLLGEHCELHGMVSIFNEDKKGYRNHPETQRWQHNQSSLIVRHALLVEEMTLRNFNHQSPLGAHIFEVIWPEKYVDSPAEQYFRLSDKYKNKEPGRIPLPSNIQELWGSHKYSVMARSYNLCKSIGREVADNKISFEGLAVKLVQWLQQPAKDKALKNTLFHMWGYVSKHSNMSPDPMSNCSLLKEIQMLSHQFKIEYLVQSTALGELGFWCRNRV